MNTEEEITELKADWKEIRNRFFLFLMSATVAVIGYGIWVGTIQSRIAGNAQKIQEIRIEINAIEQRQQTSDIAAAEIKTKLINIESSLLEIKQALRIR